MDTQLQNFYKNALIGSLCEPLCDEYKNKWRACKDDKERLVALSLNQQSIPYFATYCAKGKGVTRRYILDNFGAYINGKAVNNADGVEGYTYGLYVDFPPSEDLVADKDVSHIMWTTGASVIVKETSCVTLYVSNRSKIHLVCEGYNNVRIYLFDTSQVEIEKFPKTSNVTILKYSQQCKVIQNGRCIEGILNEHEKELRL